MATLTILVVFLGTFLAVLAAVAVARAVQERYAPASTRPEPSADLEGSSDLPLLLKAEQLSTISFWDRLLVRLEVVRNMKGRIAEAGLQWSVGRVTAMMLLSGTLAGAILGNLGWVSFSALAAATVACALAPYLLILRRRSRRLGRIEEQFPDALDSLARALRAGHSLLAGFEILAAESPAPVRGEIRKTADERNLGLSWELALANFARRVPIEEVSVFAAAVQLQNRTGGKLHEVLGRLAETIRESYALKSEIKSIAAHGKLTGLLLTVLPLVIAAAMSYVAPSYFQVLWQHPRGKDLVLAAVVCLVAAHLVIRKMVDIRI